jgi:hypothetical protein
VRRHIRRSKSEKQVIKFNSLKSLLGYGFALLDSLAIHENRENKIIIFRHRWTLLRFGSWRIGNMVFASRHYKATSIVLCLGIGSPLWNFGIRN